MRCMRQVQFEVADVTKRKFLDESFDVIFSRDTILHIEDKHALLSKFYVSTTCMFQHWRNSQFSYFLAYPFLLFSFSVFTLFSCRFRAVD